MFIATTTQQTVAMVLVVLMTAAWLTYALVNGRRGRPEIGAEIELAPNRKPYFDDDSLETSRLERFQLTGLAALLIIGVGLPLYWLAEPGRQEGAIVNFDETFAHRGEQLFDLTANGGFNCAGCHGGLEGLGGEVPFTFTDPETGKLRQVQWKAPSLNDVTLRMTDEQILYVLTYGRPFSPMPAWGTAGGGPMTDQQLDNLVSYLHKIALTPEEARTQSKERADLEMATLQAAGEANPSMGSVLFNSNCARCHTAGFSYGEAKAPGSGFFGPALGNVLTQFPERDEHVAFVAGDPATGGIKAGARYGFGGQSTGKMPYFTNILTSEQIEAIVDYERDLAAAKTAGKDQ
ncbi:MAG: cytochrome c [Acidimicrobiales bacterium]